MIIAQELSDIEAEHRFQDRVSAGEICCDTNCREGVAEHSEDGLCSFHQMRRAQHLLASYSCSDDLSDTETMELTAAVNYWRLQCGHDRQKSVAEQGEALYATAHERRQGIAARECMRLLQPTVNAAYRAMKEAA